MVRYTIFILFFALCSYLEATIISPKEAGSAARFIRVINESVESGLIDMRSFESWNDIENLPPRVQSDALGSQSERLPNISDYFSILPPDDRFTTESGLALFVLSEPFSFEELYRNYYEENNIPHDISDSSINELRWIIYLQDNGLLVKERLQEADFQELIKKHGLAIEKTKPYRFNMNKLLKDIEDGKITGDFGIPEGGFDNTKKPAEPSIESTPTLSQRTIESKPVEVAEEVPDDKSWNWWLWLIGLLVVVGGLGLVLRRKS